MARNVYNISRVADGVNFQYSYPVKAFKGVVDIELNFDFTPTAYEVVKLKIAASHEPEKWFEGDIPKSYRVTLAPIPGEYTYRQWIMVTAVYNNFKSAEFFIPIYTTQPSYYSDLDGLRISQAQFIDSANNGDMYVVFQNSRNDVCNMLLRTNTVTEVVPTSAEVDLIAAVSAAGGVINPIATDNDDNLKVVYSKDSALNNSYEY